MPLFNPYFLSVALDFTVWNTQSPGGTPESRVAGLPRFLALLIDIPLAIALRFTPLLVPFGRFFQFFDQLRRLRMWKMQLLDEHHLFIKYTSEDVVTLRVTDPSQVHTHIKILVCMFSCWPLLPLASFVV